MSNQKLKDLTAIWYERLAKEGFQDIEEVNSSKELLKKWDSHLFKNRVKRKYKDVTNMDDQPESFLATQRYYQIAEHFLNSHSFRLPSHKLIWKMHSEGDGVREIALVARKRYKKPFNRDNVALIVKNLADIMLKEYHDSDDQ